MQKIKQIKVLLRAILIFAAMLLGLGSVTTSSVLAERGDRTAPTRIDAEKLDHDEQKLVTRFSGNVVLTKGTLVLQGDSLELRQLENGLIQGIVLGQPARFRQKREGRQEWIEGEGQRIDYDGRQEVVLIAGQSIMRRTTQDKLLDQISGDRLRYDNRSETYQVESGPGSPRARMTLMPREGP